jgi:lipopolysaccharide/colanic/teichoic acid biosynthesis glycosyltransferase
LISDQFKFPITGTRRQKFKHWIDVVICLLFMPFVLLVMALCAIAIYLDSGRPIFFVQDRIGKDGHLFRMYKFRTMRANLDTTQHKAFMKAYVRGEIGNDGNVSTPGESKKNASESGIVPNSSGVRIEKEPQHIELAEQQPRQDEIERGKLEPLIFKPVESSQITRVGWFLRKTSLDELPQVFNVLKGEMSLVGPRPNVPWEFEEYQLWHSERLEVLPGITGLAQVKGRSSIPFGRIVRYDIEYIAEQSLVEDFRILLRTVFSVFSRRGAK